MTFIIWLGFHPCRLDIFVAFLKVDYKKDKLRFLSGLEMRRVKGNMFPGYVAFFLVCGVVSTYQRQRSKEGHEEMRISRAQISSVEPA